MRVVGVVGSSPSTGDPGDGVDALMDSRAPVPVAEEEEEEEEDKDDDADDAADEGTSARAEDADGGASGGSMGERATTMGEAACEALDDPDGAATP